MNWKKEGYKVGNKAYMTNRSMWNNVLTGGEEVEIVYVGTKILKVKHNNSIIEFKGKTFSNSSLWGYYYEIYLNEEEYIRLREEEKQRTELAEQLKLLIGKAPLSKLKAIEKIIKEK